MTNIIPEQDLKYIKGLAGKVYKKSFSGIEYDDLVQEGVLAYLKMKKKYDEAKNNFFMGFAYKRVYGAMLDWVAKHAYNKGKSVRKTIKEPDYKVVPTPEDIESFAVNDKEEEVFTELIQDDIKKILREYFTPYEINLLYNYFNRKFDRKSIFPFKNKQKAGAFVKKLLFMVKELNESL